MKKLLKIAIASMIVLGFSATVASADVNKGQKLYLKKLKKSCGFTGAKMSAKYSQEKWEAINDKGALAAEIKKICPTAKDKALKSKYIPHYYDFFYEYANDSGNVPSC